MIIRIWHGWTREADADAYEVLLKNEIFVGIGNRRIPGYHGIQLLRRKAGAEVEFITIKVNTGGKFNDDVFQFSVGLNGIVTKAVNALSAEFEVTSFREGKFVHGAFKRGKLAGQKEGRDPKAKTGTLVRFTPDPTIFSSYEWNDEFILKRLRYYAYLNSGLRFLYNGETVMSHRRASSISQSDSARLRAFRCARSRARAPRLRPTSQSPWPLPPL
jgi:DNA gyrase/topoisomerase IV subunit B